MRSLTATILVVALVAAFAFVAGCTGTETGDVTHLRIGYQPSTHQTAHMTAMEKGWWQEDLAPYGITQVTDYNFPTGAPEMQAMLSGDLDIAYVGSAPFIAAVSTGLDAKIVAAVQTQGSDLVLRNEVAYSTPADLVGKKIATFPPGTIQDTILRTWLEENGVDPASVTIVAMDPGAATTAISAGQVDGVFLPHPSPSVIAAEGTGRTVVQSGEMLKDHACCVLVASGSLIRDHPEIVEQVVKTHIRATEYNLEHQDEAASIYSAKTGQNIETVKASFRDWDGTWTADPNVITTSVVEYTNLQYELGYIDKPLTEDDLFDLSFYEKARA
ncbi:MULTISPECIES: ABC transporter substrate-binding protein [unclassified Methanoculleus]|uniref:ABC transporter substrate-binding protein n=1 Tax=unclassified Methanoculleus TaxID=2619537 RepID=UPI002600AEE3|nr:MULTISPECIES: ABC transporter substrate-binding protein [unclassified Methanoculleus]MCK9317008.1 ABC transporter substrate-binding protein [Methanoculleus sp.]MDD2252882.1 ABC transporter substrate-binding protein [Methanoculleus sp.]MDD2788747.1 ABC transporter substrate-binding protein [Methanoculleus sp.]MDD3215701.1 ABC transporter substrate-binding protein [Methanoculleus sp.]MDD4313540.1 ABC transporter substrate-binding protein [Methanoculleus sp.]